MDKQILNNFKKGFSLTNKSLVLFLIGATLSLLISSNSLFSGSPLYDYASVAQIVLAIIYFGYSFALPVFLVDKQQGKPFKFNKILSIALSTTKRLILPGILLLIFLMIIGSAIFFLIAQYVYGGNNNFLQHAAQTFSTWNIIIALLVGLFSFLTFTPIYFSLEENGLFNSMKKSIKLGWQNLQFIIILFVINIALFVVLSILDQIFIDPYKLAIHNIVYAYQSLLFTAASLSIYQNKKNHTSDV